MGFLDTLHVNHAVPGKTQVGFSPSESGAFCYSNVKTVGLELNNEANNTGVLRAGQSAQQTCTALTVPATASRQPLIEPLSTSQTDPRGLHRSLASVGVGHWLWPASCSALCVCWRPLAKPDADHIMYIRVWFSLRYGSRPCVDSSAAGVRVQVLPHD
jgi:hypothetical protein